MAHLIDKSTLVEEIEKNIPQRAYERETLHSEFVRSQRVAYNEVLSIIDTLEVKEVDLEKAIDDYIYTHDGRKRLALELDWKCCNLTLKGGDEIIKFAKHFYELGLKARQQ